MKLIFQKIGLLMMILGLVLAVAYSFIITYIISSVPHFDIVVFCEVVLPALFVTGITLFDRLFGGLLGASFSVLALTFGIYTSFSTVDTKVDLYFFAITVCFLLGSAGILTSLAIHAPRQRNAGAL
jgi:hypothetical protein